MVTLVRRPQGSIIEAIDLAPPVCVPRLRHARRIRPPTPESVRYTRENTLIVPTQGTKVCLTCKRARSASVQILDAELIPTVLSHARQGATVNAMLGRGPTAFAVPLAPNSVTLTQLTRRKTPQGRELKQLLKQNERIAHAMRSVVNAWLPAKREFLAAQFQRTRDVTVIAAALNQRFGSSHTLKAVDSRASKWKIRVTNRPSIIIEPVPSLSFPPGSLMERLVVLLPKNLARDHRDDLISEIALAAFEGRVLEPDLEAHLRQLIRSSFKVDHNQWGDLSPSICRSQARPYALAIR